MVRKIVSSIIIIMIICSFYFVYATELPGENLAGDVQIPENNSGVENKNPEVIKPDIGDNTSGNGNSDITTENNPNTDKENNTNTKPEQDGNTSVSPDSSTENNNTNSNPGEDNNTENNVENPENNTSNNNNQESNSNNNTEQQPELPPKQEQQKPIQNNSNSSNNNNYVQPKSSEARLKNLKVDVEGLTPEFDKNTTEYYLVVDLSVKKIKVTASTVDNKAKWAIYGNNNLKEGENTVTIVITAEDGTKKEYYIHITKVDDVELANAELNSLEIEGYNIYPSFKANIYSYNLNINEEISSLDIKARPQNEKATIKIEGNESLQEGENIIKINVTAENKETVRTYKINTYISFDKVEIKEESKIPAIILIIVLGTAIIALGIFIAIKNRR